MLVKCIDLENEIRGLFKVFGIKLPPILNDGSFDAAVRGIIETDTTLSHSLLPLLDARLVLYHCYRELDNRTHHMAHADPVCTRLMSASCVRFITALTYKTGVENPHRFKHSRTAPPTPVSHHGASSPVKSTLMSTVCQLKFELLQQTSHTNISDSPLKGPNLKFNQKRKNKIAFQLYSVILHYNTTRESSYQ